MSSNKVAKYKMRNILRQSIDKITDPKIRIYYDKLINDCSNSKHLYDFIHLFRSCVNVDATDLIYVADDSISIDSFWATCIECQKYIEERNPYQKTIVVIKTPKTIVHFSMAIVYLMLRHGDIDIEQQPNFEVLVYHNSRTALFEANACEKAIKYALLSSCECQICGIIYFRLEWMLMTCKSCLQSMCYGCIIKSIIADIFAGVIDIRVGCKCGNAYFNYNYFVAVSLRVFDHIISAIVANPAIEINIRTPMVFYNILIAAISVLRQKRKLTIKQANEAIKSINATGCWIIYDETTLVASAAEIDFSTYLSRYVEMETCIDTYILKYVDCPENESGTLI